MSERGRVGGRSDVGEPPTAPVHSNPAKSPKLGAEDPSTGISSISLVDDVKGPRTPTTPTTADAATTGTESEHSSVHGRDERVSSPVEVEQPRQVIAVSVSKGPSAFFNLARKFLVTDEICDLSALEGAIVSAVDAAHLLERSKIATIVKIQTSYVAVEPKKRQGPISSSTNEEVTGAGAALATTATHHTRQPLPPDSSAQSLPGAPGKHSSALMSTGKSKSAGGSMRRARIVITVKRTEAYRKWLEDNPIQDAHAAHDDDQL